MVDFASEKCVCSKQILSKCLRRTWCGVTANPKLKVCIGIISTTLQMYGTRLLISDVRIRKKQNDFILGTVPQKVIFLLTHKKDFCSLNLCHFKMTKILTCGQDTNYLTAVSYFYVRKLDLVDSQTEAKSQFLYSQSIGIFLV